jgi:hypothetical protein
MWTCSIAVAMSGEPSPVAPKKAGSLLRSLLQAADPCIHPISMIPLATRSTFTVKTVG